MSKPKESALDLAKFVDKGVRVKLSGGREGEARRSRLYRTLRQALPSDGCPPPSCRGGQCTGRPLSPSLRVVQGILKGYDQLLNIVLDEAIEYLRGERCGRGAAAALPPDG